MLRLTRLQPLLLALALGGRRAFELGPEIEPVQVPPEADPSCEQPTAEKPDVEPWYALRLQPFEIIGMQGPQEVGVTFIAADDGDLAAASVRWTVPDGDESALDCVFSPRAACSTSLQATSTRSASVEPSSPRSAST